VRRGQIGLKETKAGRQLLAEPTEWSGGEQEGRRKRMESRRGDQAALEEQTLLECAGMESGEPNLGWGWAWRST